MELTQRLECTQEISEINNDKIFPDQVIQCLQTFQNYFVIILYITNNFV